MGSMTGVQFFLLCDYGIAGGERLVFWSAWDLGQDEKAAMLKFVTDLERLMLWIILMDGIKSAAT